MNIERHESGLLVCDYDGTARSGKGTIVQFLLDQYLEHYPAVTAIDTGRIFRGVALLLQTENYIHPGMPDEEMTETAAKLGDEQLVHIYNEANTETKDDKNLLYSSAVSKMVAPVAAAEATQFAVNSIFTRRVEAVRDNDEHHILLADGRNRASVVRSIEGINLVLSTFVTCNSFEAAIREAYRNGFDLDRPSDDIDIPALIEEIENRNLVDANRKIDPVKPAEGAIDYWEDLNEETQAYHTAKAGHVNEHAKWYDLIRPLGSFYDITPRIGIASEACRHEPRPQIEFDTSPYSAVRYGYPQRAIGKMTSAAKIMFEEVPEVRQVLQLQV